MYSEDQEVDIMEAMGMALLEHLRATDDSNLEKWIQMEEDEQVKFLVGKECPPEEQEERAKIARKLLAYRKL